MDNAAYIGLFRVRERHNIMAMPARNPSGLWQAWRLRDGGLVVQPVDGRLMPSDDYFLMREGDFNKLLTPAEDGSLDMPPPGAPPKTGIIQPGVPVRAMPDLLTMWYEEALREAEHKTQEGQTTAAQSVAPARPGLASVASDEAVFTPARHPDDLLDEVLAEEASPPHDAPKRVSSSEGGAFKGSTASVVPAGPPPGDTVTNDDLVFFMDDVLLDQSMQTSAVSHEGQDLVTEPAFARPETGGGKAEQDWTRPLAAPSGEPEGDPEQQALLLEERTREAFDSLVEKLDRGGGEAEQDVLRLLDRDDGFTWKHKYMFTEFGMLLRRKRKPELALACHLRALSLSPRDEHILFNVARAEFELGNQDNAEKCLEAALEAAPDFTAAKNFLLFLQGR